MWFLSSTARKKRKQNLQSVEDEADRALREEMIMCMDDSSMQISQPELLKEILNSNVVMPLFRQYKQRYWKREKIDLNNLYKDVHKNHIRVLAMLILLRKGHHILHFRREGVADATLPLVSDDKRYASNIQLECQAARLDCFSDWDVESKKEILRKQWYLDVPHLKMGPNFTVEHEDFRQETVLPWCESGKVVSKGAGNRSGGYSSVKLVYIDKKYHGFHDVLEEIGLPSGSKQAFALKILEDQEDEDLEILYQREMKHLKDFNGNKSRHLVTLLKTFTHIDKRHFLFPWAVGDLCHYWRTQQTQPRELESVRWFSKQLLGLVGAVSVLHWPPHLEHQYARHGDLKPDNILWFDLYTDDRKGILVLSDMGFTVAHRTYSRSKDPASRWANTPEYRAPEFDIKDVLPEEDAFVSRAIDIWTLGCIFLEMLVFFLGGNKDREQFKEDRSSVLDPIYGARIPTFFILSAHATPPAEVKQSVLDWMDTIRRHQNRSQFSDDVVNIVQKHMIVVDPSKRADIKNLQKEFDSINSNCENNRRYCGV